MPPDDTATPDAPAATPDAPSVEVVPDPAAAPAQPEVQTPDVGEALKAMNDRLDSLTSRIPEPSAEPAQVDNIFDALRAEAGEPEVPETPEEPETPDDGINENDALSLLYDVIDERLSPHIDRFEQRENDKAIIELAEQYPDLRTPEVLNNVAGRLRDIAQRYGNPKLQTDPQLVEQAYKAFKAEAAAAAETPAEAGAAQGASIEQGAGPGAPEPEVSQVEKEYAAAMAVGRSGGDVFT